MSDDERGYAKVSLADVEPTQLDDVEPTLFSVGYELRPSEMRPNVWRFEPGEATNDHRHTDQEELYVLLEGSFDVQIEQSGGDVQDGNGDDEQEANGDREEFTLTEGDFMVISPASWRQLTATEESMLLVVGAPPVKDDDVRRDEA